MEYANICLFNAGPIDFISYISYADIIITNSFHCSAFSLIMQRQFFVVPRSHQKVNSRMMDLLDYVNAKDHYVTSIENVSASKYIDYTIVQEQLENLIKKSREYINKVLNSKKYD